MKATRTLVALSVTIGGSILCCCWYLWKKRNGKKQTPHPQKWIHLGTLHEINMFPVKSCREVTLTEAECRDEGLLYRGFINRRLLPVCTSSGQMAYAGTHPRMLSIKPNIVDDNRICLSAPELDEIIVDLKELTKDDPAERCITMTEKGYRMRMVEASPEHHRWFSKAILQKDEGFKLFIVLEFELVQHWWHKREQCEFNPVMVLHTKSIEDLNSRLLPQNRAHHLQFRGNLLIASQSQATPAFDEDNWQWLRIGDDPETSTILRYAAPSMRCIFVNIDLKTLQRNRDFEPLTTLRSYRLRQSPKEPEMGVYFDVYRWGAVRQGQPVYVQYKK